MYHTATLLPNGKVLVAGGIWCRLSGQRGTVRSGQRGLDDHRQPQHRTRLHTATLLPNGKVLVAGGYAAAILRARNSYDIGLGFVRPDWQPQIATVTSPLILDSSLTLTGSRFQGISQASGGNYQDSSTNYPLVQLRSIDNSQVAFLPVDPTCGLVRYLLYFDPGE